LTTLLKASSVAVSQEVIKYIALKSAGNVSIQQKVMSAIDVSHRARLACERCYQGLEIPPDLFLRGPNALIQYLTEDVAVKLFLLDHSHNVNFTQFEQKRSTLDFNGKRKIRN
jgi:hypothetical protein